MQQGYYLRSLFLLT